MALPFSYEGRIRDFRHRPTPRYYILYELSRVCSMADVIFNSNVEQYKKRLKDMGDGTYAEVVYVVGGGNGGGSVESVNGIAPDQDGNVVLTATDVGAASSVNSIAPDQDGDVVLTATDVGAASSVNNIAPDGSGNIVLTATDVGAKSASYQPTWDDVTDKPATFPPVAGVAVANAEDEMDIVAQFNALLASLRASGAIET